MNRSRAFFAKVLFASIAALSSAIAGAAVAPTDIVGMPDNTFKSMNAGGLEGEFIDLRTMSLSWETTDLLVPGNGGLDIRVARSYVKGYSFGEWAIGSRRFLALRSLRRLTDALEAMTTAWVLVQIR